MKRINLLELYHCLDKKGKVLCIALIVSLLAPFFFNTASGADSFPPNTTYYTNYYADGHMTTNSDGTSIIYYPYQQVFPSTYRLKGGSLYTEYGKIADVSISGSRIRIYNCKTDYLKAMIGHTWKAE